MGQLGSMDLEMENEHAASAPAYIEPRGGQTCSLSESRWRSDEGLPLMITPLPGIGRGDIHSGTRSLWRYAAHRINQGAMPDLSAPAVNGDFYFVPAEDPETAVQRILELVRTRIPKRFGLNPIRDVQVLCPMNRGGVGARSLNIELQAALNPAGERKVERFGWTFAPGDKVMQIENDYDKEVYNGESAISTTLIRRWANSWRALTGAR